MTAMARYVGRIREKRERGLCANTLCQEHSGDRYLCDAHAEAARAYNKQRREDIRAATRAHDARVNFGGFFGGAKGK